MTPRRYAVAEVQQPGPTPGIAVLAPCLPRAMRNGGDAPQAYLLTTESRLSDAAELVWRIIHYNTLKHRGRMLIIEIEDGERWNIVWQEEEKTS